jgi:hypothetical protein
VPKFKDMKGREWDVATNVLTLGRVREEMSVNLTELLLGEKNPVDGEPENKLLDHLTEDVVDLARVLYLMIRDQAETQKVTQEDFYGSLDGDALKTGLWAVLESVVGFSQSLVRPAFERMLKAAHRAESLQEDRVQKALQSPELDAAIEAAVQKALNPPTSGEKPSGGDAGNLPESSESTSPTEPLPSGIPFGP